MVGFRNRHEFPLHLAARVGPLERVIQLISGGMSVDSRDDEERTPLHWAAEDGLCEVAQLLISYNSDQNLKDSEGRTPVMLAAHRGHCGVVELLSSLPGCDLNLKDREGRTPAMLAGDSRSKSVVDLLLQLGAQVNCADDDKYSLLHRASRNGWTDVVRYILDREKATDVNAADIYGNTPLMWAAIYGHKDVAALLIRAGADVSIGNEWNLTPLHRAACIKSGRVVRVLLEKEGLDLDPQDSTGRTPLHKACRWGHRDVIERLLAAGADTALKNDEGETALSEGIGREVLNVEEIRLLVQHGAILQDCDYVRISQSPDLKEDVLKDVDICTQSIVNKYHRHSLPALKGKFSGRLPSIEKFNLLPGHICDVENFVKWDIQENTFCNVIQARPIVLRIMCVESLLAAYRSGVKRSAPSDFSESNLPLKQPHHNLAE